MILPRATARTLALILAAFVIVMATALAAIHLREERTGLLTTQRLETLRQQLDAEPANASLREETRQFDLALREDFFRRRIQFRTAGWLVLVAIGAAVVFGRRGWAPGVVSEAGAIPTEPSPEPKGRAFAAMSLVAAAGLVTLLLAGADPRETLPPPDWRAGGDAGSSPDGSNAGVPITTAAWPSFRGPGNLGIASGEDWPTTWSLATGHGIAWRVDIPASGKSSPILAGDRLFLTGGDEAGQHVMAFDAGIGRLLWDKTVSGPPVQGKWNVPKDTGYAASTPATDGRLIAAVFANGRLAAFDLEGRQLWMRDLGAPDSAYGFSSSLLIHNGTLIVQFDQGSDAGEGKSTLFGLDVATGEPRWRTPRPVGGSWSSPSLLPLADGRAIVLACANPWVIAYDPIKGAELWRASVLEGDVAPSAAFDGERVFVAGMDGDLSALRIGGQGDVTSSAVVWKTDRGVPDTPSPVAGPGFLLQVDPGGEVNCFDSSTGAVKWTGLLDGMPTPSPIFAGGRVYLTISDGVTHVIDPSGATMRIVGRGELGETVFATPAFANGRIFIRGEKRLVCVGGNPR